MTFFKFERVGTEPYFFYDIICFIHKAQDTQIASANIKCTLHVTTTKLQITRTIETKYVHLEASHFFVAVAIETVGVLGPEARSFIKDLGHRIMNTTLEPLSAHHLRQRIAVAVQRGNAAAILGFFGPADLDLDLFPL